jgi:hypothetical protein
VSQSHPATHSMLPETQPSPCITPHLASRNMHSLHCTAHSCPADTCWHHPNQPGGARSPQVCDDSTKESVRKKVDAAVIAAIEKGHQVQLIRRDNRQGFKAGAMVEGMERVAGQGYEYVAIFDAGGYSGLWRLLDVVYAAAGDMCICTGLTTAACLSHRRVQPAMVQPVRCLATAATPALHASPPTSTLPHPAPCPGLVQTSSPQPTSCSRRSTT